MAIDPLSILLLNIFGRAAQSGVSAFGASRENEDKKIMARNRRAAIRQSVKSLQDPNILPLIEASSRQLTKALEANSSSNNGIKDGVSAARANDLSADIAARLASTLINIEQQNNRTIAELLQDEAFAYDDPNSFNLGIDTFLGAILGAGGGLVEGLGTAYGAPSYDGNGETVIPPNQNNRSSGYQDYNDPVVSSLVLDQFLG